MVFWVFGYGSLVWNPGFQYDEKVIGFVKDHRRVFDLACIDHRGTPHHPARTCTLEKNEGSLCWGAAFCVRGGPEIEKAAMAYLEKRECEYDQKSLVDFYKEGESEVPFLSGVIAFTSTPDKISNKYYLGPAPLEEMARQIATASGPCGNNRDYLFSLEKALSAIGHEEDYVIELANEVRKVLGIVSVVAKEKKSSGPSLVLLKSSLSPLKLALLPEAIAMDSLKLLTEVTVESFSSLVWKGLASWSGVHEHTSDWESEKELMIRNCGSKTGKQLVYRLVLATAVYHIWIERNFRRFQQRFHSVETVIRDCKLHIAGRGMRVAKVAQYLEN